jgi:argininosuccinate synthase
MEAPEEAFSLTRAPRGCPDEPARLEISFDKGLPVGVNGVSMPLVELFDSLSTIAGAHGVGRADGLWFSPFRDALDAYVQAVQARVSGAVRLRLFKGGSRVVGCRAVQYDQPSQEHALAARTP